MFILRGIGVLIVSELSFYYCVYPAYCIFTLCKTFNTLIFSQLDHKVLYVLAFILYVSYAWKSSSTLSNSTAYLLVKVFPVILCHQSKQREEGPTKWVKAGVTIVWVPSHSVAWVPLRTLPATNRESVRLSRNRPFQYSHCMVRLMQKNIHNTRIISILHYMQCSSSWGVSLPSFSAGSTKQWIWSVWRLVIIAWWGKKENCSFGIYGEDCGCQRWLQRSPRQILNYNTTL